MRARSIEALVERGDPARDQLHLGPAQASLSRARVANPGVRQIVCRAQVAQRAHLVGHQTQRANHVAGPASRPEVGLRGARIVGRHHRHPRLAGAGAGRAVPAWLTGPRRGQRMFGDADAAAEPVDADQGDDGTDDLDVVSVGEILGEARLVPRSRQPVGVGHHCMDDLDDAVRKVGRGGM